MRQKTIEWCAEQQFIFRYIIILLLDTSLSFFCTQYLDVLEINNNTVIFVCLDELAVDLHKDQHINENIDEEKKNLLSSKDDKDKSGQFSLFLFITFFDNSLIRCFRNVNNNLSKYQNIPNNVWCITLEYSHYKLI